MTEPTIKTLRADHLAVDRRVQRSLDPRRVDKLAETFDKAALGTVIISHRNDGVYHIVDGQHRIAAMKQAGFGDDDVSCMVHEGLSLAEEAALFRQHNDTKQVRPTTKFVIRVIEGEPKAVKLSKALSRHGWAVTGATGRGYFTAVAALEWVHDGGGLFEPDNTGVCDTVLNVLTVAYGHNPDGVRNELIRGLGLVILRYGEELDLRKLSVNLAEHDGGPLGVIGDARQLKKLRSDNIANSMAEVLVGMVNKGRRTKRIPEWRDAA